MTDLSNFESIVDKNYGGNYLILYKAISSTSERFNFSVFQTFTLILNANLKYYLTYSLTIFGIVTTRLYEYSILIYKFIIVGVGSFYEYQIFRAPISQAPFVYN